MLQRRSVTVTRIMRRSQSAATEQLFDDFERSALTVTRRGTVQHGANGVNRLSVATDDAADVTLAQLHFEDRRFAARNFGQHHVVRDSTSCRMMNSRNSFTSI